MKKFLTVILAAIIFILCFTLSASASDAKTKTTNKFDGKTYTHYAELANKGITYCVDLSEHNGLVNFYKLKGEGVEYVIIRVGYRGYGSAGTLAADKYFYDNMDAATSAGLKIGVYFYSQAVTTAEAEAEANFVLTRIKGYTLALPVFFDYEFAEVSTGRLDSAWSSGRLNKTGMTNNTLAFCKKIKAAGYRVGLYCSAAFLVSNVNGDSIVNAGYPVWLAYYTTNSTYGNFWHNKSHNYIGWQYGYINCPGVIGAPSSNWIGVKYNGKTGYISASYAWFTAANTLKTSAAVTMRSGKGSGYSSVSTIPKGTSVSVTDYPDNHTDGNFWYEKAEPGLPVKPNFTLSATDKSVKISWPKVADASFYRIYAYTDKYSRVTDTTSLSYTVTGLKPNTNYTYLVRAFDSKSRAVVYEKSDNKTIRTYVSKPSFSLSSTSYTVTASWSKVTGASYYRVYSYDAKEGYTRLKQTTALSYSQGGLKPYTKYTYLVRAFDSRGYALGYTKNDHKSETTHLARPDFSLSATDTTVTASWHKVPGAAFYRIYSYNNGYAKITDTTALSYTAKGLNNSTTYTYLVRAFEANNRSSTYTKACNKSVKTYISKPNFALSSTKNSVTISWDKVKDAAFYRVYSYDGHYTRLTQTTALSYNVSGLKSGTAYTYLVRAFDAGGYSSPYTKDDNKSTNTYVDKPVFTLDSTTYTVKIKWEKVTGASFYRVYSFNEESGYTKLTETTALSYAQGDLTPFTEYTYLVRAFDARGYALEHSKNDRKSIMTHLARPDFKLSSTKNAVTISWDEVPGAAFYRIYSYNGGYSKIIDTKDLSYTVTGLKSNTNYTYLVRAFEADFRSSTYSKADNRTVKTK